MENSLTPEQTQALIDALGPGNKPDIVKQNGIVYQVKPDGTSVQVQGIPAADPKLDTSPTTIHVVGRGWLQYNPAAADPSQQWTLVPGTQEAADTTKLPTFQGADGRQYEIKHDGNGNPFAQVLGGDNPTTVSTAGSVVGPGQGVRQPDGSYNVPVPAAPAKTAEQIAAESAANVNQSNSAANNSNVQAANVVTPAQRIKEIHETAQAQADAALKLAQDKIDSGVELSEKDRLDLQNKLASILAETQSNLRNAEAQSSFDREQPDKTRALDQADRTLNISQQNVGINQQNANTNAAQAENTRINNEQTQQFNRDQGQATVLTAQAASGQTMLDRVVKAGVAPSMGSLRAAINPLQMAFQIMQGQVKDGSLSPNNVPTPMAPRPAGTSAASVPTPAPTDPNQAQY